MEGLHFAVNTKINVNIKERPIDCQIEDEASNFPDGIEDEHIVIHESGKVRVRLVDDEDLASVTWTQRFMMDLPIIVDTSQQPFSSWIFPKIKVLLCIN
ncbi:hypothetical protein RhiirA4_473123 [Rhizophagus irregularis]|uniref:Uncharacterized protein n=1 Tax=Rhizophagus irregularis TaxID=588596 RepID=A0A2I1H654_9GLOM|nr:hypothetical protein RhiirA4_473123 [Rhizophagus irregularis]